MKGELNLINSWVDIGVIVGNRSIKKIKCPECSHTRTDKRDKSLSIVYAMSYAKCHYCNTRYKVKDQNSNYKPKETYKLPDFQKIDLAPLLAGFLKSRGIEDHSILRYNVTGAKVWMPGKDGEIDGKSFSIKAGNYDTVAFNYYLDGEHVNTKFRASQKRFKMNAGSKLVFFGIDHIRNSDWCAIQEGELDTMTAYQCGITYSVSVPNGASIGNQTLPYLDNCIDFFINKKKIIIAVDGDAAGRSLSTELIRRLGAERCWMIEYPDGCKDTNEVYLKLGKEAVKKMYDEAKQVPIEGVASSEYVETVALDLYDNGYPATYKIGFPKFDQLLSFKPGELTTITGIPSMGKSTFLDQVLVKLAARFGWKTVYFSPENEISTHTDNLIKKFIGKPTKKGHGRCSREEFQYGLKFVNEYLYFMEYSEMDTNIDGILAKAREMIARKGINALVIDPWNCIEHQMPRGMNEPQYISSVLSKITSFAKINHIHIFLVAHPTKIEPDPKTGKYPIPTLYKISGAAHFFNKTYNGFTVHVDWDTGIVDVHVQKVKFEYVGKKGLATFEYDKPTGRYREHGTSAALDNESEIYAKRIKDQLAIESLGVQADLSFSTDLPNQDPPMQPEREPGQLMSIDSLMRGNWDPPF